MPFAIIGDRVEYDGHHVATMTAGAPPTVIERAREAIEEAESDLRMRIEELNQLEEQVERLTTQRDQARKQCNAYATILGIKK